MLLRKRKSTGNFIPVNIRKAKPTDSPEIAALLLLAMEEIVYEFLGKNDQQEAFDFMHRMVSTENNQYSWQNTYVISCDAEIAGAVNDYDGGRLKELRGPVAEYIQSHTTKPFHPEDETQAGEI
mgnify:CR=1 FL=1